MAPNKPSKKVVFTLNDHYEILINPLVLGLCMVTMALATVLVPYLGLLTVPTYLAILFAVVSEKIDIRDIDNDLLDLSEEE